MAVNLSQLQNATVTAQALSNLILVWPQDNKGIQAQNAISKTQQPKKFLFNFEGENTAKLESDVTDHYIENNTVVNDQIALKPEMVTTQGFISELNDVVPEAEMIIKTAKQKLTTLTAYTPELTTTALNAYNAAFQAYQIAQFIKEYGVSSWSSLTGSREATTITGSETAEDFLNNIKPLQNRQQRAYQEFYGYWKNRTLFTVQTPWAIFKNMVIQSMDTIQDRNSTTVSEFNITFKLLRFASTDDSATSVDEKSKDGRFQYQDSKEINTFGSTKPVDDVYLDRGFFSV